MLRDEEIRGYYLEYYKNRGHSIVGAQEIVDNLNLVPARTLADAAYKKGQEDKRQKMLKWLMLYAASTEPHPEEIPTFCGVSPVVPCWRFRIPDEDLQILKESK
ncbi:MAG: hypothetical protein KAS32_05075 [Candidatus Peribacteraceae bacterium]|nr:hypothetical protein [Candidatus Peribacteraceae bacterium]